MAETSSGMNPAPMRSYSLASRCVCAVCFVEPKITSNNVAGDELITLTAECHGEKETRTIQKSEFRFTQKFFAPPGEE